jgi:ABC-type Fe3+/spermidine/putrescine transport system ATPase subunit
VITVDQLTKRFGGNIAVDSLGFNVKRGEIFAIVGAGRCGKSTLLR